MAPISDELTTRNDASRGAPLRLADAPPKAPSWISLFVMIYPQRPGDRLRVNDVIIAVNLRTSAAAGATLRRGGMFSRRSHA
jgi:hypothetical protein